MFKEETVFVLGAGASWHYGYPTGEELIDRIVEMAKRIRSVCKHRLDSGTINISIPVYIQSKIQSRDPTSSNPYKMSPQEAWEETIRECESLIERVNSLQPLVIDYFLAWNQQLGEIGRLIIAAVILECEASWHREDANQNRRIVIKNNPDPEIALKHMTIKIKKFKDNWIRFVAHKLVYGSVNSGDLLKNLVRFITFNYDNSLEIGLRKALLAIAIFDQKDVEQFFNDDRFIHIYGSVHKTSHLPETISIEQFNEFDKKPVLTAFEANIEGKLYPQTSLLNIFYDCGQRLRTIESVDKDSFEPSLKLAKEAINQASLLYLFGYGFDTNNNNRIGLNLLHSKQTITRVFYTNFDDNKTITNRASSLFTRNNIVPQTSTRNVYEAIERDFDALGTG